MNHETNPSPGEVLRDELQERCWSSKDLADLLRWAPSSVEDLLQDKISVAVYSHELAAVFGTSAEFWVNLDTLWRSASQEGDTT